MLPNTGDKNSICSKAIGLEAELEIESKEIEADLNYIQRNRADREWDKWDKRCKSINGHILVTGSEYECSRLIRLNSHASIVGTLFFNDWKLKVENINTYSMEDIQNIKFDEIYIAVYFWSDANDILHEFIKNGIALSRIRLFVVQDEWPKECIRVEWLCKYSMIINSKGLSGNVAECGVFQGAFAQYINEYFADKKLYLFDTFGGFENVDILAEPTVVNEVIASDFQKTSVALVMQRMPLPNQCVVKVGKFPSTARGVEDTFCFVSLDMDLYLPMLEGLRFFWPRMEKTGVILIHDYYANRFVNVQKAVEDYEKEIGESLRIFPICDECSVGIIK